MNDNGAFGAWRKGDLIQIFNKKIRLTSERYIKDGRLVCNTDEGKDTYIPYIILIEEAKLIETISGRKNI